MRLLGKVPHAQLDAYYSAADIFALKSHREGSGYALIEALACGSAFSWKGIGRRAVEIYHHVCSDRAHG